MENTIENARKFYVESKSDDAPRIMRDYASACSAQSSIGEDGLNEFIEKALRDKGLIRANSPTHFTETSVWLKQVIIEAISRLSERKIVLPSEEDLHNIFKLPENPTVGRIVGNDISIAAAKTIIDEIKRLNGIN